LTSVSRLEVFNSAILHNLSDNANLIYGILTAHKAFEDLGTFTLARGLREIKRVQLAKEELARRNEAKLKANSLANETGEEEEPSDEKARLLESEQGDENGLASLEEGTRDPQTRHEPLNPEEDLPTQPLGTSEEQTSTAGPAPAVSEKARGKRRAQRSMSMDTTGSLERIAAAGVGKNGFVPTQEWVSSLSTISRPVCTYSHIRSLLGNKGKMGHFVYFSVRVIDPTVLDCLWMPLCWSFRNCYRKSKNCKPLVINHIQHLQPWISFAVLT
jgi:hypothetical protein